MTQKELKRHLRRNYLVENERCEWKEFKSLKHAVSGRKGNDIISYISAIANMEGGHLVVGIKDETMDIVGIQDFHGYSAHNIKLRVLGKCTNLSAESFWVEEFRASDTGKTVWVFHIPKHDFRLPVYAHDQAWQRIGDNLVKLTRERLENIRNEVNPADDWTAKIVQKATLEDLDDKAIEKARTEFKKRNPKYIDEVDDWDNKKFLNKAKLTIRGKITRAALILLGKEESEHLLGSFVKIRWNLKTVGNQDKDYEIFSIPFILAIDATHSKIRNLKYRYLREGSLFPDEVLRFDPFNIREPLNNAIAHQDYTKGARINVVEFEDDHLVFSNYGTFLPESVEEVVLKDTPEEVYRNPFLVEAMRNLDMIETQGGGIRKMFDKQRERFFPMPDYYFDDGKVKVTITGKVLNEDFARILARNPQLKLADILLLDKVQKRKSTTDKELKYLRKLNFVEGRKPNIYLSDKVVKPTHDQELKAEYIHNRSFDDEYFKKMIINYLSKFGQARRKDFDHLIIPKLSDALNGQQKKSKVGNLLSALRIKGKIETVGYGTWKLTKKK